MDRPTLDLDGLTPLPSGKLAAIVTHLAMERPAGPSPLPAAANLPDGIRMERLRGRDMVRYLGLFRAVGERWLWVSRLKLARDELSALLDDDRRDAFAVTREGRDIALVELDATGRDETELVYFGIVAGETGRGLGKALMAHAVALAFSRAIQRLTVHTCTLDDPRAIPFYLGMGFSPVRQEIELMDDPRLTGLLPADCAPHMPVIGKA